MSDLDRAKDSINNTRLYMSFIVTFVIALGAGISSLYSSNKVNILFWIGSVLLMVVIAVLAKRLHEKTDQLKDL